ncbi:hypothetical protein BV22DRAFT_1134106 [Leucogyrophana mollusca]|uniref:Uncharacterized protein n=1 Tax=Leucogyrophana mollusca TaxID=85980 RepID=A0ACB8B1S9_9AGAM|nr:hypothetical protein BV22DRAFT_1134106 [Leucogyrophana mollusca]
MKHKQDEEWEYKKKQLGEKRRKEAEEQKAREAEERRERERKEAEEVEHQKKAAEEERARAEAEAAKQKQAGSVSGSTVGSTRLSGKGKGKVMEGVGQTLEELDVMMEEEELVVMVKKCQECETKKKDCWVVIWGGKPMACDTCRKSKAKCSLLPESEQKREWAGMVASPRGGEKRKKNKIAAAIAAGENQWDSDREHQGNRDMLGGLSQSMMGLTEEVHKLRMDIHRGLRLFDQIAIAVECMANIEPVSPNTYTTDEEEEGPVASGSGRK